MDCFAMNDRGKCGVLGTGMCQGAGCGFHKTKEEQEQSLERERERLRSLPKHQQDAIADKYYGGVKRW